MTAIKPYTSENDRYHPISLSQIISRNMKKVSFSNIFTANKISQRMVSFRIEAWHSSPEVFIDKKNHLIEISGSSTLKNSSLFYSNLLKWAIAFNLAGFKNTTINIKLKKINDSSTKWLMLIIKTISTIIPEHNILVNWYYDAKNTTMQINGERIKLNSIIPINLIAA